MSILGKGFKIVGQVVGEVIVAGVGMAAIYSIGWVSGVKSGCKLESTIGEIKDAILENAKKDKEEETNGDEVTEDSTPVFDVSINQPED